jgi:hypothetical protein
MTQTVASSRHGQTTTAASGQFEHEHVVVVATMVPVFLMELVDYFDDCNDLMNSSAGLALLNRFF